MENLKGPNGFVYEDIQFGTTAASELSYQEILCIIKVSNA